MRKLLVVLLCLLAVFTIVSCKHEPDPVDPPAPGPLTPEEGKTYYRLTATRAAKRFAFMYSGDVRLEINPKIGDTLVVKYRTNHEVTTLYLRDSLESVAFAKKVDIDEYITEPDEDGWITFTFTYPETPAEGSYRDDDSVSGFLLELANYKTGAFDVGDYLDIKGIWFSGEWLTIEAADEDTGRSEEGVWNRAIDDSNKDHTIPTLEVKAL